MATMHYKALINKIKSSGLTINQLQDLCDKALSPNFIARILIGLLKNKPMPIKDIISANPIFSKKQIIDFVSKYDSVFLLKRGVVKLLDNDFSKSDFYITYGDYFSDDVIIWFKADYKPIRHSNAVDTVNRILYVKGKPVHRDGGPAIIDYDRRCWYQNGKLSRDDGPAIEPIEGDEFFNKEWFRDGNRHREDGFAIEYGKYYKDGEYWLCNKRFDTKEEWEHYRDYLMIME